MGGGRGVARSGSVRAICDNNMYAANLVPMPQGLLGIF